MPGLPFVNVFVGCWGEKTKNSLLRSDIQNISLHYLLIFQELFVALRITSRNCSMLTKTIDKRIERINRLKVVLAEKNRKGKWLAEQLGKNEATVSRWCSNTAQPSLEMLVKIAKILDIETKDLINSRTNL